MPRFDKKTIIKYVAAAAILVVIFGAGWAAGKFHGVWKVCKPETADFSLFWDAYNKLHENFINPDKITDQKLLYGAIDGMTKSLGDPYTSFFDPDQAKAFEQQLAGSFEGIGVEVGIKSGQLTVIAPLQGTPGEKAGLKAGDQIVKINGTSTQGMALDEAVNIIRGQGGTPVTLTIFRDGWTVNKDIKIVRATIKIVSVDWQLKDGGVAYIHMHQFDQNLANDFKAIAPQIKASGAKKIILDLRDNPGGYLDICQQVAGWFLQNGQLVTTEDFGPGKEQQQYTAEGNAEFANYPMVVLINKGSASASEILSGALRDDRNVQLIGETSFGKGSVQQVVPLGDGASFLKITIAKWLTPKGNSISEIGLTPDVAVAAPDTDTAAGKDPQLAKALEIIAGLK